MLQYKGDENTILARLLLTQEKIEALYTETVMLHLKALGFWPNIFLVFK